MSLSKMIKFRELDSEPTQLFFFFAFRLARLSITAFRKLRMWRTETHGLRILTLGEDLWFKGEPRVSSQPKASMRTRMENGDFLNLTVWPGKKDPTAEVITVQIRRLVSDQWQTVGKLAAYRTADGRYSQLPERPPIS